MLTLVESLSANAPRESGKDAAGVSELRMLAAGEILFREGEPRTSMFRIESGALCLYRTLPDGTKDVLEFAFPGDLVGLGYLDSHVAAAQATMETQVSTLPRMKALDTAFDRSPRVKVRLTAAIEREVEFLKESLVEMGRPNPVQQVASLFVTLSRNNTYEGRDPSIITDSLECGVVAGYLGMSVDQLATYLTELKARGLIEASDKGLHLKDLAALESLADGSEQAL